VFKAIATFLHFPTCLLFHAATPLRGLAACNCSAGEDELQANAEPKTTYNSNCNLPVLCRCR